jgi:hypothetical protein
VLVQQFANFKIATSATKSATTAISPIIIIGKMDVGFEDGVGGQGQRTLFWLMGSIRVSSTDVMSRRVKPLVDFH